MNLVADLAGVAAFTDPDLINPWGMALDDQNRAFWMADNGSGKVSIVDETGAPVRLPNQAVDQSGKIVKLDLGEGITGVAHNPSSTAFLMTDINGCAAARMLFSSEKGQIIAVNDQVDALRGIVVVDRSAAKASYKGLAIIQIPQTQGQSKTGGGSGSGSGSGAQAAALRILAPDFFNARIDVYDENFTLLNPVLPSTGSGSGSGSGSGQPQVQMFQNPAMPAGYAPFNVVAIEDKVYVTYGKQDAVKGDAVKGAGLGMVDEFDLQGNLIRTFASPGQLLNAPWGVALAPNSFCNSTANALLVGNFGDGHITAFDVSSGRVIGQLSNDHGQVLVIDGLWSLMFGDDTVAKASRLFFTSGPGDEAHGLFGYLESIEGTGTGSGSGSGSGTH